MSEIIGEEKNEISQNSKENLTNCGIEQNWSGPEKSKLNPLEQSIEKREQEDIDFFDPSTSNDNNSVISGYSSSSEYIIPIYILCSTCNEYFDIKSLNMEYMDIECGCKYIKNYSLNEFEKEKDYNDGWFCNNKNFGCKLHSENNSIEKFVKYCDDCKKDLCQKCLEEIAIHNNPTGKHTTHETHDLIDLLDVDKDIAEVRKLIEVSNFEKKSGGIKDSEKSIIFENDEEPLIKKLIMDLLRYYKERPSYNGYKAIKVSKEFLSQPFTKKIEKNLKREELFKINSIEELKEKINYSDEIYKIIIEGEETKEEIENLNIFKYKNFNNLEIIQINTIKKLYDIEALASCSFPELKELVIGTTELDDKCIDVIKKLKLPKIKFISFFNNKITSPEIFGAIEHFDTLEKFYIGLNQIDINKLPDKNTIYNFPKNLVELGISRMFNKNTNSFITEHLNLENIKLLYVSGNEIVSLQPFDKIEFKQLEEFWIRGNEKEGECLESIEDIKYLHNEKSIKKIVVKQNKIKDIEKLVDIILPFQNLELFNIEDNAIDKEKMKFVINKIKEKGGLKKLEFKYN